MNTEIIVYDEKDVTKFKLVDLYFRKFGLYKYHTDINLFEILIDSNQKGLQQYSTDLTYLACILINEIKNRIKARINKNKALNIYHFNELLTVFYTLGQIEERMLSSGKLHYNTEMDYFYYPKHRKPPVSLEIKDMKFLKDTSKKSVKQFDQWFNKAINP